MEAGNRCESRGCNEERNRFLMSEERKVQEVLARYVYSVQSFARPPEGWPAGAKPMAVPGA
jgi:hypothetical protein